MQNFRPSNNKSRSMAVDGILPGGRSPRPTRPGGQIRRNTAYRPEPAPPRARATSIGDFRQPATAGRSLSDQAVPLRVSGSSVAVEQPWDRRRTPGGTTGTKRKPKRKLWPFSRKKKFKTPLTRKQKIKRTFLALLVLGLLFGGAFAGYTWWNARKVLSGGGSAPALEDCADLSQLNREGDCRINVMLLGKGGGTHEAPDLTDTIIIASIDPVHNEAALVSIPRDLYVQPEGQYGYTKINAVYANAKNNALGSGKSKKTAEQEGLNAIEQTLESKLDIPIHYYGMIDFKGFEKAIDTVGGITIDVKTPLVDPSVAWENNWNPTIAPKGVQEFDGKRALLYARSRQSSPRGDFDRSQRQREVIVALKDKVFSAGTYSNPVKISQLIEAFGSHIETNFSIDEIMKLYGIGKDTQSQSIKSIGLSDPPNDYLTTGMYNGQSVVMPKAGVDDYGPIRRFIRRTLVDPRIREENASVVVLNGTSSAGLGKTKADMLKSYGYNVIEVGDAPSKDFSQTVVVDLRDGNKKFTKHYLERRFNTSVTGRLPDGITVPETADFVIIIGQNEAGN